MLKRIISEFIHKKPVNEITIEKLVNKEKLYFLYQYRKEDGTFDYDEYRRIQIEGNKSKIGNIWVVEENIKFLSNYIKTLMPKPSFGICHGTRRGKEQEWFSKYLNCKVLGTEISDTALQFPNTIQWDFHEVKPEWIHSLDFIYSNSFDHSYDPEMCLRKWMTCLNKNGICIIEHSRLHGLDGANELDPFGAELYFMPYLIAKWSKGSFFVRELLDAPCKNSAGEALSFIIIQNLNESK